MTRATRATLLRWARAAPHPSATIVVPTDLGRMTPWGVGVCWCEARASYVRAVLSRPAARRARVRRVA